jgi:hypothetical protein
LSVLGYYDCNARFISTIKAPPYEVIYLRHTPLECPRLRYSVSREAPEEVNAGKDRKEETGNAGAISPE